MKLKTISVIGLRSVACATLEDCGGFNVLIGKNNAGKSTILLAINSFFGCLRSGIPVAISAPIGRPVDFYDNENEPITLACTFLLAKSERDTLVEEVILEAPQVRNAVAEIVTEPLLEVTIAVTPGHSSFAYVKRIQLQQAMSTDDTSPKTLLEIGSPAAEELAARAREESRNNQDIQGIGRVVRNIDREDWERFKLGGFDRTLRYLNAPSGVSSLSREAQRSLEKLMAASETAPEFKNAIETLISSQSAQSAELRSKPLTNRIGSLSGEESAVPRYALNLLDRVAATKVLYLTERREPIGKPEAAKLLELKVRRGGPEKLRAIQEIVTSLLGVEIDAFRAESSPGVEPAAEMDVDRFLVQVNGAGIREALRLVLDNELEKPSVLLVEEPEIHLHPALELSMMRYLRAAGLEKQIFITTHSTNFLDTAEMRNVYLVSRNGSTKVQLLNMAEAENNIPRELGIRLSSLFMFDRLVFVEGPSDEDVIREMSSLAGVNLGQANVGFIAMGGARNFAHYATENVIGFLSRRQVKMIFVLDRDERDDEEVKRLAARLGDRAELIILERREIENYLLEPCAVAKFIEEKLYLGGHIFRTISVPEVRAAIEECANGLKVIAVERRVARLACRPLYPNRNRILDSSTGQELAERVNSELALQKENLDKLEAQLPSLIEQQERVVENQWETRKTEIVPGDILLDEVCRKFGVRFNKERDSARLARLMNVEDLAQDIRTLIRRIGA